MKEHNFTEGPILGPLVRFALPVLLALILQAMYGAVDLLVVGRFGVSADVSAVSTGSQLMMTITNVIASFSMGTTILLSRQIGEGNGKEGGRTIGASLFLFLIAGIAVTVFILVFSVQLCSVMQAPEEAYDRTVSYVRICGSGALVIIAYNLIGSVFRGLGDSKTPLITVAIACAVNIAGDLFNVAVLGMGAAGAAAATVAAQGVSVLASLWMIHRQKLPFAFSPAMIRPDGTILRRVTSLGLPIALQDLLVGLSFLIVQSIVNSLGLIPSAGVGVAEKACAFIMLIPSAFMQSLSAFVSQNIGAGKYGRAWKTLYIALGLSACAGAVMFYVSFFHGDMLAGIFSSDPEIIATAWEYLKAYAFDCLFTAFMFCFIGFYNGVGLTKFVMAQGIIGAFCVRVPVSFFMSRQEPVSIFHIGLATPCSTVVQILLCLLCMVYVKRNVLVKRPQQGG